MPFPPRSMASTSSSTRACFPTSLPPRPKVASGSSHGGGRSISPSTPTGTSSSRSSSIGKKDKIYYSQRNGLVPKTSHNNMSARDFNQDKRKSGSKQMILHVTHKDTAGNVDPGVVTFHNESSRPTATIGRRTPTNKSKFNNRDVSRQPSPDKSSYKSYNDGFNGDLYAADTDDNNSVADRDRSRAILEMLYGKPGEVKDSLPDRSTSPFGFVYGVEYRAESGTGRDNPETPTTSTTSCTPKQAKRFSSFLSGLGMRKLDRNRSTSSSSLPGSWLWQKSLSEGNLYSARKSSDDEYDGELLEEINDRRNNHYHVRPTSTTSPGLLRSRRKSQQQVESGAEIVKMSGMRTDHEVVGKNRMEWERSPSYEYSLEGNRSPSTTITTTTDPLLGRTWLRNSICTNNGRMDSRSDVNAMAMRQKSVPKFFRSISLRNLLPIGGMNKSRTGPPQGKRVSPPTVPGLVSFSSFRVKKSQQLGHPTGSDQQLASPSSESGDTHHLIGSNSHNKETQRYSGSSLGSAGSSYASSASSSDNRSSIGTDDGFLPPPCIHSDVRLKDVEEGVLYHPASQQIHLLKSSSSVDSFSSASTTSFQHIPPPCSLPPATHQIVDMHQGFYGKVGGINSGSNSSGGSSANTNGSSISPHVTVHVDPHPGSANVQQQQQHHPQQVQNSVGATNGVNIGSASASTSVASGNSTIVHHQPHHSHHPHHHHHLHQNHVTFSTPATALSMTNTYQTQISLDDQGIDMTQSPGRESPSSTASSNTGSGSSSAIGSVGSGSNGCRHSTASFDSGRASSTIYQQGVRYSGLSSESSSGSFRHSYHSSSSSLGSIAPEEICNFDVAAMIAQGIPDHEVLNAWLTGIHFETYYQNFIQAGYDMHTISRMTPEDLNAIGVTKPHHRKRLKSEISQLNISDGLPDYIPGSIEEWLSLLKLDEYTAKLHGQGYHSVRQVTNITWEDLEDLGVLKLGHQKKFMLAIKRIEDILAGKRIPTSSAPNAYLTPMDSFPRRTASNTGNTSGMGMSPYGNLNGVSQLQQFHPIYSNSRSSGLNQPHHQSQQQQQQQIWRQSSHNASSGIYAHLPPHTLTHQPQLHHVNNPVASTSGAPPSTPSPVTPQYYPDVISIQVKNGRRKSMENVSAQEPIYGTSSFLPSQNQNQVQPQMGLGSMRSGGNTVKFEEGDITPTNETVSVGGSNVMSTATLPRLMKNKPIAKIMGGGMNSVNCMQDRCPSPSGGYQQSQQISQYPYGDGYKSLPRDIGRMSKAGLNLYSGGNYSGATKTLGKTNSFKSGPPPPPRRGSCSGAETSSMYTSGQQILSSFGAGNNVVGRGNMPPPPPNLSCDQFSCSPPSSSRIADEFPPPPHPDDLVLVNQPMPAGISPATRQGVAATNAVATAVNNASPNNIALKMNAASATVHYHNSSNSNHQTLRNSPPSTSTKSREPSPVGSDFSDSDLPPGGLLSRGVRRNGSDASFKSNSSTESESIPFANDNAGTIKQQKPGSRTQQLVSSSSVTSNTTTASNQGTGDVLNDIGNMLADLTDELDAILEQEMNSKR
ncbi:unnamed protein product [Allacma fusca]|uniref:SAM domain-containing protein n=1 Tax=Allacma fusca TaxID=39272 RepID=A0A8J2M934_9HEXA|nr:unnamed protein product [Allacma fusca]